MLRSWAMGLQSWIMTKKSKANLYAPTFFSPDNLDIYLSLQHRLVLCSTLDEIAWMLNLSLVSSVQDSWDKSNTFFLYGTEIFGGSSSGHRPGGCFLLSFGLHPLMGHCLFFYQGYFLTVLGRSYLPCLKMLKLVPPVFLWTMVAYFGGIFSS